MSHPSKTKGNAFEREIVSDALARGLQAERAWGSNGAALGEAEAVDVVLVSARGRWRIQAKRRQSIPGWLREHSEAGVDATFVREDRGRTHVIMDVETFYSLILADPTSSEGGQKSLAGGQDSEKLAIGTQII